MNPGLQQVAKRGMDQAVTSQPSLAGKGGSDDQQTIVPAAAFGTCMARVPSRVVDHFKSNRIEDRETLPDDRFDVAGCAPRVLCSHAGSTFLNGFTATVA